MGRTCLIRSCSTDWIVFFKFFSFFNMSFVLKWLLAASLESSCKVHCMMEHESLILLSEIFQFKNRLKQQLDVHKDISHKLHRLDFKRKRCVFKAGETWGNFIFARVAFPENVSRTAFLWHYSSIKSTYRKGSKLWLSSNTWLTGADLFTYYEQLTSHNFACCPQMWDNNAAKSDVDLTLFFCDNKALYAWEVYDVTFQGSCAYCAVRAPGKNLCSDDTEVAKG